MEFKLTIDASPALLAALQSIADILGGNNTITDKKAPVKKVASKQDTPANTSAEEQPAADKSNTVNADSSNSNAEEITKESLRALGLKKSSENKRDGIKALLAKFEISRISEVPADKFTDFYNALNAL
jgi:predicted component of type VI protein secretion system